MSIFDMTKLCNKQKRELQHAVRSLSGVRTAKLEQSAKLRITMPSEPAKMPNHLVRFIQPRFSDPTQNE